MIINENLIETLSHENIELVFCINEYLKVENPISKVLNDFINSIPEEILLDINSSSNKLLTRKEKAILLLNNAILEKKMKYLYNCAELPEPYNKIKDIIEYDEDYLINTENLSYFKGTLKISDIVYNVLPSIQQKNSLYWVFLALEKISKYSSFSVRLDPFIYKHINEYRPMMFKMEVYGVPLNWDTINKLKGSIHSKWMADNYDSSDYMFTEAVWERRSDGVHFICEETPKLKNVNLRGSRYFHSIYDTEKEVFTHADGAIRIYSLEDLENRNTLHVRKSGKVGKRVKIFKVNGIVKKEDWCSLVSSFFLWNDDIKKYFDEL